MSEGHDPRVYFAAERTLLAWVRTGLGVIGMGFVVARFGLFLRMMRRTDDVDTHARLGSTVIGVGLLLLGSVAIALAAWRHVRFQRGLDPRDIPLNYGTKWPVWFAMILAVSGVALAGYLLARANYA